MLVKELRECLAGNRKSSEIASYEERVARCRIMS
jgi:hypothetical protein